MVGQVMVLLWMAIISEPRLVSELDTYLPNSAHKGKLQVPACLYETIPTSDFSRQALSRNAHRLVALRLYRVECMISVIPPVISRLRVPVAAISRRGCMYRTLPQ